MKREKERIIFVDAKEFPKEIQKRASYLVKRIGLDFRLLSLAGLKEAISALPYPDNEIMMVKFGLESGKYLESNKEILKNISQQLPEEKQHYQVNLIVRDALESLKREDYMLYYDLNIINGMKCFCQAKASYTKLIKFRYLQLLMAILEESKYENMYYFDCDLQLLDEVIENSLSKQEQFCLKKYYGLDTGFREPMWEIARDMINGNTINHVNMHIYSALIVLNEEKEKYLQFPVPKE